MQWAPDGEHALVRGTEEIGVIDRNGKVAGSIANARAWMPDSQRVIVVRAVPPKDWNEYAALLGEARTQLVISAAEAMRVLLRDYRGDWSKFADSNPLEKWQEQYGALTAKYQGGTWMDSLANGLTGPVFFLAQKHPEEVAPLLKAVGAEPGGSELLQPRIAELVIRSMVPDDAKSERLLARTADDILWCRAAPHGEAIAYVVGEPVRPALYVVSAGGGDAPVRVDEGATEAAWTPDGAWLVYIKTTLPFDALNDHMGLGTITRRRVCTTQGKIAATLDDAEDLAGLLLGKGTGFRVACLPDNRILFAGVVAKLPGVTADLPREITLFTLRIGETPVVTRVIKEPAPASLPNRLDRFVINPSGELVAIPGDSGEVAVVSIATGEVELLQPTIADFRETDALANSGTLARPAPAWRGANELCYVIPRGDPRGSASRGEVIMQTLRGESQTLSKTWPDALADRFLPRAKP
jgi:hypothetical protein